MSEDTIVRIGVYALELSLTASLIFWIKATQQNQSNPLRFYLKLLLCGGLAAFIAAIIEVKYSFNVREINRTNPELVRQYGVWYDLINNASGSLVEELAKYIVALFTILNAKRVRKLSDAIVYLIIIGLGFSLIEDFIFLLDPQTIAPYRLLSFYVHSGTSAVIGYSLGRFMSGTARYPELIISIMGAVALHFTYNLSTTLQNSEYSLVLTIAIAAYISLQIFVLFRKAVEEEYRLGHRFRGETTQRLLNLSDSKKNS